MPRTALVTGANRGIGLEVCRQLAHLGMTVHLAARDPAKGQAAAKDLSGDIHVVALDVADPAAPNRVLAATGPVDVLVNNAGIHYDTFQGALTVDWTIADEALQTNFLGPWRLMKAFAPTMRRRGWGRIVNVSSQAGSLQSMGAGTPTYATSKAALNAITRVVAAELAGSGVLVNAVCPGWTATDMGGGGRPIEEGARSVVWGVTLPDNGPSGGFYRDGKPLPW